MRFDSPEHLVAWQNTGRFPWIHDAMYAFVAEHVEGSVFLDLCCSTGLMGERIRRRVRGARVVGVESDRRAIAAARSAGITFPILELRLGCDTLARFREFVAEHGVQVVLARRCIPELCGGKTDGFGPQLVAALAGAGVKEVVLQGRVDSTRAVNQYRNVEAEIRLFAAAYKLATRRGQIALVKKELAIH